MGFLDQLKNQASALQSQQATQSQSVEAGTAACEQACRVATKYVSDLAQQLAVIQPPGPAFSLDGKTPWPAMKLTQFRADARKKMLRSQEVHDQIAMGWDIVPAIGGRLPGSVKVNFPPDLERVQNRLAWAQIKHERKDHRHPETNKLLAYEFIHECQARGNVLIEPDHDRGIIHFRVANVSGFDIQKTSYPAEQVTQGLLDELAKLIVGQPSRFLG